MLLPPGPGLPKKKKPLKAKPPVPWGQLPLEEQQALAPGAPVIPGQSWGDLINFDPLLIGDIANIDADEVSDRSQTMAALRSALIRMGGGGLSGVVGKLGAGWEELLDPTTLAAAQAGDQGGTSISAQLDKAHRDKLLAEEDIRAARGILSSGQSGYEIGEERQRNTIANNDAIGSLLEALKSGVGGYASRVSARNTQKSDARAKAMERALAMGLTPRAPQVQAPPTSPAMIQQLRLNARRPVRRPIRYE